MQKSIAKILDKYTWAIALLTTALLFLALNILTTPLLNSGDDAFFLYTLGGGYGETPTSLLHYDYGWHPWLGAVVKDLFLVLPGINAYTLSLLFFHLLGCSSILYVLLKKLKTGLGFFFFFVLFFFFETRMLLSLTFTGAALVAATGASFLLIYQLQIKQRLSRNIFIGIILLLLAGMLRLQIVWLNIFLFTPLVFTWLNKPQQLRWAVLSGFIILVLLGMNKIQEHEYKKNITGWQQQEDFRQTMFYAYNRPLRHSTIAAFTDSTEQQLFFAGFLYDSVKFSVERVNGISKKITRQRWLNDKEDYQGLFWFFIEMRIYLLLFAIIIILLLIHRKHCLIKKWLLSVLAVGAIYGYLFIFLKITAPIHLGLLMVLWIQLAVQLKKEDASFITNKTIAILMTVALLALFSWMGIRIAKQDKTNRNNYQHFLCVVKEINQHPDQLFIATDDSFPLGYFYIWDLPRQFPVKNLLYKDRLLTHTYLQTLKRFGITNLTEAMRNNNNVMLLGPRLPALEGVLPGARISDTLNGFHCLMVRRLLVAE